MGCFLFAKQTSGDLTVRDKTSRKYQSEEDLRLFYGRVKDGDIQSHVFIAL